MQAIRHELLRLERITEAMVGGERRKPTDSTFKSLGQFFDECVTALGRIVQVLEPSRKLFREFPSRYVAAPIRFQHALEDEARPMRTCRDSSATLTKTLPRHFPWLAGSLPISRPSVLQQVLFPAIKAAGVVDRCIAVGMATVN